MNFRNFAGIITATLIFLFSLNSCSDEPLKVGLELLPEIDLLNAVADTLAIECYTVKGIAGGAIFDTKNTNDNAPIGHVTDPIFGDSWADVMMQLNYNADNAYKKNPIPDTTNYQSSDEFVSCKLYLHINKDRIYGSQNGFNVNMYPLTKLMYYTYPTDYIMKSEDFLFNEAPVSDTTIHRFLVSDKKIEGVDSGNYFLVLGLDQVYGKKLMDTALYDGTLNFKEYYPGYYLQSQAITENGGMNNFKYTTSRLVLEYKRTISDTTGESKANSTPDTTYYETKYSTFKIEAYNCLYRHNSNLSPAGAFNEVLDDTVNQREMFYVQSLGGVRGLIKIPELDRLKAKKDSIGINLAEIVFPINAEYADTINFFNPLRITIQLKFPNGTFIPIPDDYYFGAGYFNGKFEKANMEYRLNLTEFVHQYISGTYSTNQFYLMPSIYNNQKQSIFDYKTPSRIVLNSGLASKPAYLRVIYTKTID